MATEQDIGTQVSETPNPDQIGFMAIEVEGGFKVWDRRTSRFTVILALPTDENQQKHSYLRHLKDCWEIAQTHGFGEALAYKSKASDAYWGEVNAQLPFRGVRF